MPDTIIHDRPRPRLEALVAEAAVLALLIERAHERDEAPAAP